MKNNVLYHASTIEVSAPLTNVGRKELDFGPGFYLTNDRIQAENWAKTLAGRKKGKAAVLNVYTFDEDGFCNSPYNKLVFTEYSIEWLDFVCASRKGNEPWKEYDWVEGGIANDSVISTVDAYVDGFITAEQAMGKLIKEELRHQVCILKQEIIDKYLRFVESIEL